MKSKFTLFLTALSLALMSGAVWAQGSDHDSVARGGLTAEIQNRIARDAALQEQINAEAALRDAGDSALKLKLEQETAARVAQDNSLATEISTEISARTAGDAALQAQIEGIVGGFGGGGVSVFQAGDPSGGVIAGAQQAALSPDLQPCVVGGHDTALAVLNPTWLSDSGNVEIRIIARIESLPESFWYICVDDPVDPTLPPIGLHDLLHSFINPVFGGFLDSGWIPLSSVNLTRLYLDVRVTALVDIFGVVQPGTFVLDYAYVLVRPL